MSIQFELLFESCDKCYLLRSRSTIYTKSTLALAFALFRAYGAPARISKADCGAAIVCDLEWYVQLLKALENFRGRQITE